MVRVLVTLVAVIAVVATSTTPLGASPPSSRIEGEFFVDGAGEPIFVLGANYEGPADRAWQMWDDAKFDPALIAWDFDRARRANVSVLRIFVQQPLAMDIRAGRWDKLDTVFTLADQQGLRLVLTFGDYWEPRLADLVAVEAAVAARYHGRETIFAYDLKNEPRFGDLALTVYPPGASVSLQRQDLVPAVGETVARSDIARYRTEGAGVDLVPARLSDDEAYVYANVLAAYGHFLEEAQLWASARNALDALTDNPRPRVTALGYYQSPESAKWDPFEVALNDTFAAWLQPQLDALRRADPGRPITVGHVDPFIASLPVNAWLDYRALHRYPSASRAGIDAAIQLFADVRAAVPGKPIVLGEFGFSNAQLDEVESAKLERELILAVRDSGGAGALKWMLNDFPQGFNARENAFGMFRGDGSEKPIVQVFRELGMLRPRAPREPDSNPELPPALPQPTGAPSGGQPVGPPAG
jgi:hypothetical protein